MSYKIKKKMNILKKGGEGVKSFKENKNNWRKKL